MKIKHLTVVSLIMLLSFTSVSVFVSPVDAKDVIQTYGFITASPNPVQVDTQTIIIGFLSNLQPTAAGSGGDRYHDLTIHITKPDLSTESIGPLTADAVSGVYATFVPDQIGTYTIYLEYPGEYTESIDTDWLPSESATYELVVNEEGFHPYVSATTEPSGYWTRPVSGMNHGWASVTNNWLMAAWDSTARQFDQGTAYAPADVSTSPDSAHILWTKPMTFGGITGGTYGAAQFHDGRSYEQFFKPPVIISGRLYYNTIGPEEPLTTGNMDNLGIECVDMKNGETLFTIPNASLSFGQIFNYISPNQAGTLAYLWEVSGTTWRMFDAWSGAYLLTIEDVPRGTTLLDNTFYGESHRGQGDVLVYSFDAEANTLSLWNSTKCIGPAGDSGSSAWQWRPIQQQGDVLNGSDGIQWVVDLENAPIGDSPSIKQIGYDNKVYISNGTSPAPIFSFPYVSYWSAYSMTDGSYLWGPTKIDATDYLPANASIFLPSTVGTVRPISEDDILPLWVKESLEFYAWNVSTGEFLWGPTPALTNAFALYNWQSKLIYGDIVYNWGYDGEIHAYDLTDGTKIWDFSSGNAGTLSPYGTWPIYNGLTIAGGKLFATTSDHGNGVEPLFQGEGIYVLNPETGDPLYNLTGWFEQPAIADGKLVTHNCYDNQIYCLGKGPSAVTVTVSPNVQSNGGFVMIQGTITDQSPGAKQLVEDGVFNNIPAISDEDQSAWMDFIYQQGQCPADAKGVPISLTAIDSSGNPHDIGTVMSDSYGMFKMMWQPPQEDEYSIVATFAGSNSYWPSYAETALGVCSGTPTTPTPSITASPSVAPSPGDATPMEVYIAIAAVVIIAVVVIAAVLLRKR